MHCHDNQIWAKTKLQKLGHNFGPMQNTFAICVQRIRLGSLNSLMLNIVKIVLPWQLNYEKNALSVDIQRNITILDSLRLRY